MSTDPERFTRNGHPALAFDSFGPADGEPVLFAHGGGQTRHSWKGAAEALGTRGWRAVAVDMRGHGDSDWAGKGGYGIENFAQDIIDFAEHLGEAGSTHLVGASLGGSAAMVAEGIVKPGSFASITLVDIAPKMAEGGADKIIGFMSTHAEDGFATLEDAADVIAEYLPHRPRPKSLDGLRKNLRQREDGRWYWHWDPEFVTIREGGDRPDRRDRLEQAVSNIACPLHLVRGRQSELVDEAAVAHFREIAPEAAYTDVADAHHMVAGDRNDIFLEAVEKFLDLHRQR